MLAISHQNLAISLRELGRGEEAREHAQTAVDLFAKSRGKESSDYAGAVSMLARVEDRLGEYDRAEVHAREAVDLGVRLYGERHTTVADYRERYAVVLDHAGRLDDAASQMRTVLRVRESLQGPDDDATGRTARRMSDLILRTNGTTTEAVTLAEQSVRVATRTDPASLPRAQFVLARALWPASDVQDRTRATTLVEEVRAAIRRDPSRNDGLEADLTAWERQRDGSG
jgi:hypothetical protein